MTSPSKKNQNTYKYCAVGESHYQEDLGVICGGKTEDGVHFKCRAQIIPEPDNPYNRQAVRVVIDGQTVGYLPERDCAEFLQALSNADSAYCECNAVIDGGWLREGGDEGSFGVKLDLSLPFVISRAVKTTPVDEPLSGGYTSSIFSLVVFAVGLIIFGYAVWSVILSKR